MLEQKDLEMIAEIVKEMNKPIYDLSLIHI